MKKEDLTKEQFEALQLFRGARNSPLYKAILSLIDDNILEANIELGDPKVQANYGVLGGVAGGIGKLAELRGELEQLAIDADGLQLSGEFVR